MERDVWRMLAAALRRLPRGRDGRQLYSDSDIIAIVLWAAQHDRSINWACQRGNWPKEAWRRRLPDQSTVSRRLRRGSVPTILFMLVTFWHASQQPTRLAILDGKPLELSEYTTDTDARAGRGAGRFAKGYKMHTLIAPDGRVLAVEVTALNAAECVIARRLLRRAVQAGFLQCGAIVLADAAYDSNRLHRVARQLGLHLLAPRKKPGTGLGSRQHDPGRVASVYITEHLPHIWEPLRRKRTDIERFFGALASVGGGLHALPPWARRQHRVTPWVLAKLAINTVRTTIRQGRTEQVAA